MGSWSRLLATAFSLALLLSACASSASPDQELVQRLSARLRSDIAARRVALVRVPGGVRVIIAEYALFPAGATQLSERGRYIVAGVIQGLLDPAIVRVAVSGSTGISPSLQAARARTIEQFFTDYGLGQILRPVNPAEAATTGTAAAARREMAIAISVATG